MNIENCRAISDCWWLLDIWCWYIPKHIFAHLKEWNRNRDGTCSGDYVFWVWFSIKVVGRSIFHILHGIFHFWTLLSATCWLPLSHDMMHKVCPFVWRYLNWAIYWFWLIDHNEIYILQKLFVKYENDTEKIDGTDVKTKSIFDDFSHVAFYMCKMISITFKHNRLRKRNIQIALRCTVFVR